MQKFIVFAFILFVAFCNAKPPKQFERRPQKPNGNNWQKNLCENQTLAENSLTKIRQNIATLQSNESLNDALQKRSNEINYLLSDENASLLSTNCTEFFTGLKDAQKVDRQAEAKLLQLAKKVQKILANAFRPVANDDESSEEI